MEGVRFTIDDDWQYSPSHASARVATSRAGLVTPAFSNAVPPQTGAPWQQCQSTWPTRQPTRRLRRAIYPETKATRFRHLATRLARQRPGERSADSAATKSDSLHEPSNEPGRQSARLPPLKDPRNFTVAPLVFLACPKGRSFQKSGCYSLKANCLSRPHRLSSASTPTIQRHELTKLHPR